jgi:signal transduction histidine kinase
MRSAIRRRNELNATLEARVEERTKALLESQQNLAHAEKMHALGQLTGGLAHDFNNMLAIILGNLEMVSRRRAQNNPDVDQLLSNAMKGTKRAAELTRRLLAYARKQPLSPAPTDVNKTCESVTELLRRTLEASISIECVRAGGLWQAFIDAAQLENALVNLALNARDAMPDGGALTIETANAYLDDDYAARHNDVRAGQYVLVSVTDTGTGMGPDVIAKAIEPFFTTKADGKGSGLGLSQVYGFIKQSGGHFAVYSEPGNGTTVRLYLPRSLSVQEVEEPHGQRPSAAEGSEAVLVVEDDEQVRLICTTALKDLGYAVYESASGAEALQTLERHLDIRILLTDVVMPGMNGRQLADRAVERHPRLRVLFMTGYSRNALFHNSMLDTGVQLLVKPFTVEQLATKIRAVMA